MTEKRRAAMPYRFVPLPSAVVDDWVPVLTGSQLKLLLVVLRQTEGFRDPRTGQRKAEDWLSHRQLMARTGCASEAISGAVDALVRAGLVHVRTADGGEADTRQRRRAASRLLYGLGPALLPEGRGELVPPASPAPSKTDVDVSGNDGPTSETGLRKSKTTKETVDNRDNSLVVFENRSEGHSENRSEKGNQAQGGDERRGRTDIWSEPQIHAADIAGRHWIWRKYDAQWVRAGDAQKPQG